MGIDREIQIVSGGIDLVESRQLHDDFGEIICLELCDNTFRKSSAGGHIINVKFSENKLKELYKTSFLDTDDGQLVCSIVPTENLRNFVGEGAVKSIITSFYFTLVLDGSIPTTEKGEATCRFEDETDEMLFRTAFAIQD